MAEALLVVDVQRGFLHPQLPARINDGAEEKMQKIMEDFRCSGREIIHIQHRGTDSSSFFYDEENIRFQSGFEPRVGEKVFTKPEPPNQKYVSHNTNFKTLEKK